MSSQARAASFVIALMFCAPPANAGGYVPKAGFVPDEQTAKAIAEAVLLPIMGQRAVDLEKPFRAELRGGVWVVTGHLNRDWVGGVAEVRIDRAKGTILHFEHGQ